MEPFLEKVPHLPGESFFVKSDVRKYLSWGWHYHPEIEICLTKQSTGQRFVGNSIEPFSDGDLVLLGENLPHAFVNDPIFKEGRSELHVITYVVQFRKDCLGNLFFELPELNDVKVLLELAKKGIQFTGKSRDELAAMTEKLLDLKGFSKLLHLLEILKLMASTGEKRTLNRFAIDRSLSYKNKDTTRISAVYDYVIRNFQKPISLSSMADVANLTENAFSKYFKKRTSKNFSTFLNEIRVEESCKMLISDKYTISQISEACGFTNLSNFNRQFKKITGTTPRAYRKEHLQPLASFSKL